MDKSADFWAAVDRPASPLLVDLYELTMLQSYFDRGMNEQASFELYSRSLPPQRNFLLAAGLEQALAWLERLRFTEEDLRQLSRVGHFSAAFLRSLEGLHFTGDVWAMPEGTIAFPDEPLLRISAPLREAQLAESRILNLIHFQTVVASKAARCVLAAAGKALVDFGLRRAHGAEAAILSARASYIAGFDATATVLAGLEFGIPLVGTMAHSFVLVHANEREAFEHFARSQPANATLLIDTYDTEEAARDLVRLSAALARDGIAIRGVRIDSGDLADHARRVRAILDEGGLGSVTIFASGGLDEGQLAALVRAGAPIDGFGVGTRMNTSADAPALDCAYKLVEYAGVPRRKRTEGKANWPGSKQVWRRLDEKGLFRSDMLGLMGEEHEGEPLLSRAMRDGQRTGIPRTLSGARELARTQLSSLSRDLRMLEPSSTYPVEVSDAVRSLAASIESGHG